MIRIVIIEIAVPAPFNKVNEWSYYMMETAVRLVEIGSIIGIDEGIIGFKGQSRHKVTIKTKPTPTGLKVWALAAHGYLLQWYWHQPGPKYGPVGVEATARARAVAVAPDNSPDKGSDKSSDKGSDEGSDEDSDEGSDKGSDSIIYSSSSDDSADEEAPDTEALYEPLEETATQMMEDIPIATLPPLNPTQAVVVALINKLPEGTYHVFLDNLFSSPDLFKALRILGIGATGTCRTNCGLYRDIVVAKENDRKGKELWPWGRICSWPTPDNKVGRPSSSMALGNQTLENALLIVSKVNQIAWKDNALVLFLSTVYRGPETIVRKRKRPNSTQPHSRSIKQKFGSHSVLQLSLPSIAAHYNDNMNAVDIADHLRSNMHSDHRQRRGPGRTLTWSFLLATALANSFLLQLKGRPAWTPYRSQSRWQQALVDDIFKTYREKGSSRQRYRAGNIAIPIDQHKAGNRGKRSACLACQGIQIGPRSQSSQHPRKQGPLETLDANSINSRVGPQSGRRRQPRRMATKREWGCLTCDVALCKDPKCWDFYHRQI
jgi:hypothetical protein